MRILSTTSRVLLCGVGVALAAAPAIAETRRASEGPTASAVALREARLRRVAALRTRPYPADQVNKVLVVRTGRNSSERLAYRLDVLPMYPGAHPYAEFGTVIHVYGKQRTGPNGLELMTLNARERNEAWYLVRDESYPSDSHLIVRERWIPTITFERSASPIESPAAEPEIRSAR